MAIESASSAEGETPTPTGGTFGLFCKTFGPHLDRFEIGASTHRRRNGSLAPSVTSADVVRT